MQNHLPGAAWTTAFCQFHTPQAAQAPPNSFTPSIIHSLTHRSFTHSFTHWFIQPLAPSFSQPHHSLILSLIHLFTCSTIAQPLIHSLTHLFTHSLHCSTHIPQGQAAREALERTLELCWVCGEGCRGQGRVRMWVAFIKLGSPHPFLILRFKKAWMVVGFCQTYFWSIDVIIRFFLLQLVCIVHHVGWFTNFEPGLHTWHKFHLVKVYNSFYTMSDLKCQHFVKGFFLKNVFLN